VLADLPCGPTTARISSNSGRRGESSPAGPWSDDSGALIVYDAIDEAEVARVLTEDLVRHRRHER
jgi:hypothetical protein